MHVYLASNCDVKKYNRVVRIGGSRNTSRHTSVFLFCQESRKIKHGYAMVTVKYRLGRCRNLNCNQSCFDSILSIKMISKGTIFKINNLFN